MPMQTVKYVCFTAVGPICTVYNVMSLGQDFFSLLCSLMLLMYQISHKIVVINTNKCVFTAVCTLFGNISGEKCFCVH